MNISVLLPYKENYSKKIAGAVSLFVNDTVNVSDFKDNITEETLQKLRNK